jgi:hypothetical protein
MKPDRLRCLIAATLLVSTGAVCDAAIPRRPVQKATPVSTDTILAAAIARAQAGDCQGALALLDPLVASPAEVQPDKVRLSAQLVRLPCLAAIGRATEVAPLLVELKVQAPDNPLVLGYEVLTDADAGRFAPAADALSALADRRSPALALIPGNLWRVVAQKLTVAHDVDRRDRTALALAEADWQPSDRPDIAEGLAADGIGTLLDHRDPDTARGLLPRVVRPGALRDMAIQRRYEALWPDIETRLGPEGGAATDRYARRALAAYSVDPGDDFAIRDTVRAFLALGRSDDAAATAAPVDVVPGMSEVRVEIVLGHVEALIAAGDDAGAATLLKSFATIDLARTPTAAATLITLAEREHETGQYDQELALARATIADKAPYYSAFGLAWLPRSETCALAALHRDAEAKIAGDALKAAADDNAAAAVEGLLCAGRDGEAAAIAIHTLSTPEGTDGIADQFQPGGVYQAHDPSRLRAMWARLLARGDVKAAFDRAARILPKPLWPSPTPRIVPILPGSTGAAPTT